MPLIYPFGFLGSQGVPMRAARFDGTDGMSTTSGIGGGISDGSDFAISFWARFTSGDSTTKQLFITRNSNPSTGVDVYRNSSNKWVVAYYTNTGAQIGSLTSSTSFTVASGWHHVLAIRDASGLGQNRLYINGSLEASGSATTTSVEWTVNGVYFGRDNNDAFRFTGDVADFLVFRAPLPNFNLSASREKFYSASGKPVYPGDSGELPIPGNLPYIYFSAKDNSMQTNLGLGNSLTVNSGDTIDYVDSGLEYAA